MKLFVSWSGEYSRQIAAALKQWIPAVIQSVEVFYSPEDIEKGDDWNSRLNQELEECKYGIVCLTPENVKAPWINFEAGALAKTMDSRVSALMLGIETSDVKGPLSRFQNTRFEKEDFKKLVRSINRATDKSLDPGVLDYIFDNMWPHLRTSLADIEEQLKTHFSDGTTMTEPERKENDALQEMLHILRKMDRKETYDEALSSIFFPICSEKPTVKPNYLSTSWDKYFTDHTKDFMKEYYTQIFNNKNKSQELSPLSSATDEDDK